MDINETTLLNKIIKIIGSTNKILVGFSGGLDSTVLLHILVSLNKNIIPNINIRAIHINHGLNNNANNWVIHCKKICLNWKIEFHSRSISINPNKKGIEAAARDARYQIFREILLPGEIIVTAQHLDDQAETFLLALKRGSGPKGLSAMSIYTPFANTLLVRPLLSFSRQQLFLYAQKKLLSWIEDNNNINQQYDRNFLRLNIIPNLKSRWSYFINSVARSANLCAEQETLINELIKNYTSKLITINGSLLFNDLINYSEIKRNVILRYWLKLYKILMPSYIQLKQIWKNVICASQDAQPKFILNNNVIRRFKKELWLLPKFKDLTKICIIWKLPNIIILPDNLGSLIVTNEGNELRAPLPNEKVTIKFGLKGKIKIINYQHSKKSKKLWQELNIAPWLRNRIPLIYYNNELITAINTFITKSGKPIKNKPKLKIKWIINKYFN